MHHLGETLVRRVHEGRHAALVELVDALAAVEGGAHALLGVGEDGGEEGGAQRVVPYDRLLAREGVQIEVAQQRRRLGELLRLRDRERADLRVIACCAARRRAAGQSVDDEPRDPAPAPACVPRLHRAQRREVVAVDRDGMVVRVPVALGEAHPAEGLTAVQAAHRDAAVGPRVEVCVTTGAGDVEQLGHPVLQILGRLIVLLLHRREEGDVLLSHAVLKQGLDVRARKGGVAQLQARIVRAVHGLARQAALPAPQLSTTNLALHEPADAVVTDEVAQRAAEMAHSLLVEAADADTDLLLGVRHLVSRVCEHRGGDEGATRARRPLPRKMEL